MITGNVNLVKKSSTWNMARQVKSLSKPAQFQLSETRSIMAVPACSVWNCLSLTNDWKWWTSCWEWHPPSGPVSCLCHAFNGLLLSKHEPATRPIHTYWVTTTWKALCSSTGSIKKEKYKKYHSSNTSLSIPHSEMHHHLQLEMKLRVRHATSSAARNEIKG